MKRRSAIAAAAALAILGLAAFSDAALARDCGGRCALLAQYRGQDSDNDRRYRPPYLPDSDRYGGTSGERMRSVPPAAAQGREPLPDGQIWAIAKSRVPGRIVNARLHGSAYSFRIISNRGSIVDLVVDRYSGRILSVRGGP